MTIPIKCDIIDIQIEMMLWMSMFDCPKCWDTPYTCGWDYRDWGNLKIVNLFENIMKYHDRDAIMEMSNSDEYIVD